MNKLTDFYKELKTAHDATEDEDVKALLLKTRNGLAKLHSMLQDAELAVQVAKEEAGTAAAIANNTIAGLHAELTAERVRTEDYDDVMARLSRMQAEVNLANAKHSTESVIRILVALYPLFDSDDVNRITEQLENQ